MSADADREEEFFRPGERIRQTFDMTIVEKIAEGGMGEVYEAILHGDGGFEKRIALKVVRTRYAKDGGENTRALADDFLVRLVNEAKLVSNLIHTHIVQIYLLGSLARPGNAGSITGYIAMEYVNGINLRSFIDRHVFEGRPVPVDIAVYIASRVARALEYAHSATDKERRPLNIVHRDVTPTNVLLSVEGVVKLSDFGIAKALSLEGIETYDYIVGKKRYMAPEQLETADVDFRADIFSLGYVMFELLTGRVPDRDLPMPTPRALRGDIPEDVEGIILRSTRRHAEDRYVSTTQVAEALERAIYDKGYGPTFVTLAAYVRELFPGLVQEMPKAGSEEGTMIFGRVADAAGVADAEGASALKL
jgi:serine/threonine-protein kinase